MIANQNVTELPVAGTQGEFADVDARDLGDRPAVLGDARVIPRVEALVEDEELVAEEVEVGDDDDVLALAVEGCGEGVVLHEDAGLGVAVLDDERLRVLLARYATYELRMGGTVTSVALRISEPIAEQSFDRRRIAGQSDRCGRT